MTDLIGQLVGRFHVDGIISTGIRTTVYKATDTATQQGMALKLFRITAGVNSPLAQRLLAQCSVLSKMDHPNIAKIEGYGQYAGQIFVASELASDGPIVSSALSAPGRPLQSESLWSRLDLVRQAADALYYAHQRNVVHLDINPKTLLVKRTAGNGFLCKVVSLGFAALLEGEGNTSTEIVGDPAYLAPEQWQATEIDYRADIYALGVVLYYVATGALPFPSSAPATAMYNHLYAAPARPTQVRPDLPAELDTIIMRCLAKRPQERFASAGDISSGLRGVLLANTPRAARAAAVAVDAVPDTAITPRPVSLPARAISEPPLSPAAAAIAAPAFEQIRNRATAGIPSFYVRDQRGAIIRRGFIQSSGLTIGTAADATVVLESPDVSPYHARIDWDGRRVTLTDLGSRSSTFLDEHRLLPQVPQEWPNGQQARIGSYWVTVEQTSPELEAKSIIDVIVEKTCRTMTLMPGKSVDCRVTLANHKTTVDHVSLSVEGIPSEWVKGTGSEVALNPYDKQELIISVSVPKVSSSTAGEYAVTIRANSVADPERPGEAKVRWTVAAFEQASLRVIPTKATGRKRGKYWVTVQNDGNRPATHTLMAYEEERELAFSFRANDEDQTHPKLTLNAGAKASVRLSAEASKRHWLGKSRSRGFKIQSTPEEQGEPLASEVSFAQTPIIPPWALILAPLVLIAFAFMLPIVAKPRLKSVSVEPNNPFAEQPVVVRWTANRASHIEVRPFKAGIPAGDQTFTVTQGVTQNTVITVVASNIFGTDVRHVVVQVRASPPPPLPEVELSLSREKITKGESVAIDWKVKNAARVEFSEKGNVPLEGTYNDTPQGDHTYTLTAYNATNGVTTKFVKVKVEEAVATPPPIPHLSVDRSAAKQGQPVVFTWDAPGSESARIESFTPTTLMGTSGQRQALLKGKGRYTFVVVSTAKGLQSKSDPVTVDVSCTVFQVASRRCHGSPLVEWR